MTRTRLIAAVLAPFRSSVAPIGFSDTFDANVDGWTAGASTTLSWAFPGELQIENVGTANGYAYREIDVTPDTLYEASVLNAGSAGLTTLRVGTTANGVEHGETANIGAGNTGSIQFTPTTPTVFVTYRNSFNGSGSTRQADNVSVAPA